MRPPRRRRATSCTTRVFSWPARRGLEGLYEADQKVRLALVEFEGEHFTRGAYAQALVAAGVVDADRRRA